MKKALIILLIIPVFVFAQTVEELDFVAPMHDGVSAINKDNSWGFIDDKGAIIIDFRDDLVVTKSDDGNYPVFENNRCLISKKKDGITYFGYIDKTGKTVIESQFLNAYNFNNHHAIVLKLKEDVLGTNDILKKRVIKHTYFEVIIDSNGIVKEYLNPKGTNVVLDKKFLKKPPKITSRFISDALIAIMDENKKWVIKSVNL